MMSKYLLGIVTFCWFPFSGISAQENNNPVDIMNSIKLEGKHYTSEATSSTRQEAEKLATMMLKNKIGGKDVSDLSSEIKKLEIKRGDMIMVFVYIAKDMAHKKSQPVAPEKQESNTAEKPVNYTPLTAIQPDLIEKLMKSQTFTSVETILQQAQNDNPTLKYGKPKDMDNPDDCYLIMIDRDWNVAGIISPKTAQGRMDLKKNSGVRSQDYSGCAVICVKLK